MNGYKINDNLYINCNNVDYVSFLNDKVKIHMNDNTSYYITQDQYADIETKISQSGGSGGGADITSNIKITGNKSDILGTTEHNKLCILSNTGDLNFKVVDKIEGGSEELFTLSEVLPQILSSVCCSRFDTNIYIFGGSYDSGKSNSIYKFNCITKEITTLSVTLPIGIAAACCATHDDNIYIFGGTDGTILNTIYKFNCTNETIEELNVSLPQPVQNTCCSIYENNIYIFGGFNGSTSKTIYKFNCTTETISTLSTNLPEALYGICCSIYNSSIYLFGGYYGGVSQTIYKFDCTTETISTLSTKLPNTLYAASCSIFNNDVYIFGGINNAGGLNTIFKFNCVNETISTLSVELPQPLHHSSCSIYESNIYLFGGYNGTSKLNTIYKFSVSFELTANNVLIYNANSNYSFDLITDQVTIPIKNIYIGDSTNMAQLANAYLYDETQSAWVNVNTGEVLS